MQHCAYKGMDRVSKNTQVGCGVKNDGTKGNKVGQENNFHYIASPARALGQSRKIEYAFI